LKISRYCHLKVNYQLGNIYFANFTMNNVGTELNIQTYGIAA
jgi:hypothetical protein